MANLRLDIELIVLGVLAAFLGFIIFAPIKEVPFVHSTKAENPVSIPTVIPTATPTPAPVVNTFSVDSSDGTYSLLMKKISSSQLNSFDFIVKDNSTNSQRTILSKSSIALREMYLPDNAWSPQKTHVFLMENFDSKNIYYAISLNEQVNSGSYLNLTDLFTQRYPGFTVQEVTGWLNENTLIINSFTDTGDIGPSFWFDVQNQSFGQFGVHYG